jgi:Holliday junction DNA helicase RuvA
MITKLKGLIDSLGDNFVVLDVQGVGYQIFCSQKTLSKIPALGSACAFLTEMVVREDFMHLYGFLSQEERDCFRLLLNVQGVGMKVALALLSIGEPLELSQAISRQDKAFISRADGVGPKLAARIVNELKDKVAALAPVYLHPTAAKTLKDGQEQRTVADAVSALVNLGYRLHEAEGAIRFAMQQNDNDATVEELVRIGLAKLSRV